ncbi:MAG: PrpF domain-containing protein [Cypionkella sp.]
MPMFMGGPSSLRCRREISSLTALRSTSPQVSQRVSAVGSFLDQVPCNRCGLSFRREHLPEDCTTLARVLLAALDSGQKLSIDGIGGSIAVMTRVALPLGSKDEGAILTVSFLRTASKQVWVGFKPTRDKILWDS